MSGGDDWQVGDLALCVTDLSIDGVRIEELTVGGVYTVSDLGEAEYEDGTEDLGLCLHEVRPVADEFGDAFSASHFRRIRPLTDEEHRATIVELASDQRTPVQA